MSQSYQQQQQQAQQQQYIASNNSTNNSGNNKNAIEMHSMTNMNGNHRQLLNKDPDQGTSIKYVKGSVDYFKQIVNWILQYDVIGEPDEDLEIGESYGVTNQNAQATKPLVAGGGMMTTKPGDFGFGNMTPEEFQKQVAMQQQMMSSISQKNAGMPQLQQYPQQQQQYQQQPQRSSYPQMAMQQQPGFYPNMQPNNFMGANQQYAPQNQYNPRGSYMPQEQHQPQQYEGKAEVPCQFCRMVQYIPVCAAKFQCFNCQNVQDKSTAQVLFSMFNCGRCQTKVIYQQGANQFIKCTRCNAVNKVLPGQHQQNSNPAGVNNDLTELKGFVKNVQTKVKGLPQTISAETKTKLESDMLEQDVTIRELEELKSKIAQMQQQFNQKSMQLSSSTHALAKKFADIVAAPDPAAAAVTKTQFPGQSNLQSLNEVAQVQQRLEEVKIAPPQKSAVANQDLLLLDTEGPSTKTNKQQEPLQYYPVPENKQKSQQQPVKSETNPFETAEQPLWPEFHTANVESKNNQGSGIVTSSSLSTKQKSNAQSNTRQHANQSVFDSIEDL